MPPVSRESENERLLRIWSRTRTECDAARDLLPPERPALALGEIGTVEQYQEFVDENEWEMAIYCLERIGRDVSVPRRFWEHLVDAAQEIGLEEYAARFRTRLGSGRQSADG